LCETLTLSASKPERHQGGRPDDDGGRFAPSLVRRMDVGAGRRGLNRMSPRITTFRPFRSPSFFPHGEGVEQRLGRMLVGRRHPR